MMLATCVAVFLVLCFIDYVPFGVAEWEGSRFAYFEDSESTVIMGAVDPEATTVVGCRYALS